MNNKLNLQLVVKLQHIFLLFTYLNDNYFWDKVVNIIH